MAVVDRLGLVLIFNFPDPNNWILITPVYPSETPPFGPIFRGNLLTVRPKEQLRRAAVSKGQDISDGSTGAVEGDSISQTFFSPPWPSWFSYDLLFS